MSCGCRVEQDDRHVRVLCGQAHVAATLPLRSVYQSLRESSRVVARDALNRSRATHGDFTDQEIDSPEHFSRPTCLITGRVEMPCSWRVGERDTEEEYVGRAECSGRRFNLEM